MTSVRKVCGVLFLGLLFTASAAMADIVTVHFDGLSGNQLGGQFTYEYYLDINGGSVITVACNDYDHHTNNGDSWDAYRTYLSSGDVSLTRFQDFTKYQEAAWLFSQFTPENQAQWGEINWAIWEIFKPGLNEGAEQPMIDQWILDAEQNYLNGPAPWPYLVILTPVNAPDQEMIFLATPEPGTMLLLGSGILGLWSQRKRIF
jgi:hypothetical protein